MRLFRNSYIKAALATAIILTGVVLYSISAGPTLTVEAITSTTAVHPSSKPDNPASNAGATASKTVSGSNAPTCQLGTAATPATPAAVASNPGMHQNVQAASYYTVYGNTTDEINNQMANCTPIGSDGDRYAGSTDYSLNWAFSYEDNGTGMCHVTAASVSINIATTLPRWQPTAGAAVGLNASWQSFITNLTTHESGHAQIDLAGAAQILSHLQSLADTRCDSIVSAAATKANLDIQAINQANDNYDVSTIHGLTQGAVLN